MLDIAIDVFGYYSNVTLILKVEFKHSNKKKETKGFISIGYCDARKMNSLKLFLFISFSICCILFLLRYAVAMNIAITIT